MRTLHVEHLGRVEHAAATALQQERVEAVLAGEGGDHLFVLEHEPVYTLGRGADASDLLDAPRRLGVPVARVGRGGGATYHGPGQVVAYPILSLAHHGRDVRRYVRRLEDVLLLVCDAFGVPAQRVDGSTGVWVEGRKIGSIGIGVRRWVSFHGVALNVTTECLPYFAAIIPCAMPSVAVTSLESELGRRVDVEAAAGELVRQFHGVFGYCAADGRAVA